MQTPAAPLNIRPSPSLQHLPGSRIALLYQPGALAQLGSVAKAEGASRVLLVSDAGIVAAGHVETAMRSLYAAGIVARLYDGVAENPTTDHVHRGLAIAKKFEINFIIGLGGGSSMDCAKGINFLLTNGGKMADYWGVNKAANPMLPLIAIPTTAGTGSEAQSAALITDPETHAKMACWDTNAAAKVAILDPNLTATQPPKVAAATGIDAIAHAVETAGTTKRNETSRAFSKAAWELLIGAFSDVVKKDGGSGIGNRVSASSTPDALYPSPSSPQHSALSTQHFRADMLLGAHLAGCAIENSMLGAAHAAANPLTSFFGVVHGLAVGAMLPHVVRFNSHAGHRPYADLDPDPESLAHRLDALLIAGHLPRRLADCGVTPDRIPEMAAMAAKQWTATFNPRPVGAAEFAELYRMAM